MDPLATMLNSLTMGTKAKKESISVPGSKFLQAIAKVMLDNKFIAGYELKTASNNAKTLQIELQKQNSGSVNGVKRISKLSRRVYMGCKKMYPVKQGKGILVVSTPKGVITGVEAKAGNVGGEVLFELW